MSSIGRKNVFTYCLFASGLVASWMQPQIWPDLNFCISSWKRRELCRDQLDELSSCVAHRNAASTCRQLRFTFAEEKARVHQASIPEVQGVLRQL
jgi:hypothetical protein